MNKKVLSKFTKSVCVLLTAAYALFMFGCNVLTTQIVMSPLTANIKVGETISIDVSVSDGSTVSWTTSDETIAVVNNDGIVTGIASGKAVITASAGGTMASCSVSVLSTDGRTLVWSDEFDGAELDSAKWGYQTGTRGVYGNTEGPQYWGNNEQQYYTKDAVSVADGSLKITAKRQVMGDRQYTSARLNTRDKAFWTYGYFEARMKTPAISGMWPAFWMLPQPSTQTEEGNIYGKWASSGEIDIMEAKGRLKNSVGTALHYGGRPPENKYRSKQTIIDSNTDEWHVYGFEWRETYMNWYVDGKVVFTMTNKDWYTTAAPDNANAPFDRPFYIILNLAVGGNYDGGIQPEADFSAGSMYVDFVRVYSF